MYLERLECFNIRLFFDSTCLFKSLKARHK
jgi:hypothetical protein